MAEHDETGDGFEEWMKAELAKARKREETQLSCCLVCGERMQRKGKKQRRVKTSKEEVE
jgi:hypothetical protein